MSEKNKQIQTIKKVLQYLGKYRVLLFLSLALAIVTVTLTLYIPKLTGNAVDYMLGKEQVNYNGVFTIIFKIGICVLTTALAQWLMNICNNKMTYQVVRDIRNEAFHKIETLPL